jgi:hypothetical protein
MSECKGCHAEMKWIEYKGKKIPVDAKPRKVYVFINGAINDGEGIKGEDGKMRKGTWSLVDGYESHHATCPEAERFRKSKKAKTV